MCLLLGMNADSKQLLFADDTSVLLTSNNLADMQIVGNCINSMNKWFTVNGLSLNVDKAKAMKFDLNYLQHEIFQILK